MSELLRRQFLLSGLALLAPRVSRGASARIDILPDEPLGTISPDLYGHFTEHIGGVIYDGIWVGENSKIPNVGGIRKELIDNLKRLKPPVIRWPGGCFADSYNWRDGVGPRKARPTRTNFWANTEYLQKAPDGPQKYEPNEFGTNEFAHLCKAVGAQPYFAANVRSLDAHDFYSWIEYCNSPAGTTTLAKLRAEGGDAEPFPVKLWGVGNESWGCGGGFTGDEYAVEFRRFTEWVPKYGLDLNFVASGPNVADYAWTHSFLSKLTEKSKSPLRNVFGLALHYYCGTTGNGQSTEFDEAGWYGLLRKASYMEELINNHWAVMGTIDSQHHVKLVVDEWGAWHKTDPSINPSYLWAFYPTLRDALVSGITLDIFNRHPDKVALASAAQMINNIHTSFIAVGDRFTVTPVFHVFEMYTPHQGGTAVRTELSAAPLRNVPVDQAPMSPNLPVTGTAATTALAGLSGSCSIKGKQATLTIVNPDLKNFQETEIAIQGARVSTARATVLTSTDMRAHNTLDQPHGLEPKTDDSVRVGSPFVYKFAPASVTRLDLTFS
ncbi:MAG TPA: alpha-L-arabinofuranosidase C-terminal domain-containing protein [Bryobacteraceae bacterium]|nr:alpha-L-arabinofuranosidase C-terminal domain-containing protein [Bryobacteraceae bacterium]